MTTWQGLTGLDREHPWLLDSALALGLLATAMFAAAASGPVSVEHVVMMVAAAIGLAARRAAPLPAFLVTGGLVVVMIAWGFSTAAMGAGLFLIAYTVAAHRPAGATIIAAGYALAIVVLVAVLLPVRMPPGEAATNLALFGGSFVLGRATRLHRAAARLEAERAALAERVQVNEAQATLTEERLRIARELHDVVGHSLGVIALQAGVGARMIESDPAEAKAALLAIADRSRGSLREVRQILGALREAGATSPNPGLAAVPDLIEDLAAAGLHVALDQHGEPWPLTPAMDLSAYRVLKESLTNVVRHAGTDRARVSIRYGPEELELRVRDHGRGAASGGAPASGQRGMRERVSAWGGSLSVGPASGGGYEVIARLPRQGVEP